MLKIKIISMTIAKPELFEEKVNELISTLEADENVTEYTYSFYLDDNTLVCIFEIEKKEKKGTSNNGSSKKYK